MSHKIVRIENYKDKFMQSGEESLTAWHLVVETDETRTLCTGLAFTDETNYTLKIRKRGGITCKHCLSKIRFFKSIRF